MNNINFKPLKIENQWFLSLLLIFNDSTRRKSFDFKISKDLLVQLESEELHPACAKIILVTSEIPQTLSGVTVLGPTHVFFSIPFTHDFYGY